MVDERSKKKYFVFEKMICGIERMLCHHLKYPYLWKQSPYSLTCLLWILLWHLGKIMNFNEWLYMLCVSDCIIASVGSIKSKDCLCIVATINVTHSFFKMCIWFQKRSVLWHHIETHLIWLIFFNRIYLIFNVFFPLHFEDKILYLKVSAI